MENQALIKELSALVTPTLSENVGPVSLLWAEPLSERAGRREGQKHRDTERLVTDPQTVR